MLIKNITFPIDLEDNYTYTVVVATAKNIEFLMDKEKLNYFEQNYPFIVVKKLTKEIIIEAIEAYAEDDAFWLKLHQFGRDIAISVFAS